MRRDITSGSDEPEVKNGPSVVRVPPGARGEELPGVRPADVARRWAERRKAAVQRIDPEAPPATEEKLREKAGQRARDYWRRKEAEVKKERAKPGTLTEQERRLQKKAYNKLYNARRKAAAAAAPAGAPTEGRGVREAASPTGVTLLAGGFQVTIAGDRGRLFIEISKQESA